MKILIVGSQKVWAIENIYKRHLAELGFKTEIYPIHDHFYDFYYKSLFNKFQFKFSPAVIYNRLNKQFLEYISFKSFDIIWVFKGMELFPKTLNEIREKGIKLVNFNPDHPFFFSGVGSGNKNVIESIGLYDLHFCYHKGVMERMQKEYNIPCHYLPFGYESSEIRLPTENEEIEKACFIGNPDERRIEYLQFLIDKGIPLDLYGNEWRSYIKPSMSTGIFPAIYKDDFNKIAPKYRVQINVFRNHNEGSHNMRTFEMPGLGCIMVAPQSDEHLVFFKDGEEAFFYSHKSELYEMVKTVLEFSYTKASSIRENALGRSQGSGYNYAARASIVEEVCEILIIDG